MAAARQDAARLCAAFPGIVFSLQVEPNDGYRFVAVSRTFLEVTGLTEEQVVGKLIQEVIPAPYHALVLSKYAEAIRTGQTVQWEEVSTHPAGRRHGAIRLELRAAPAPVFVDGDPNRLAQVVGNLLQNAAEFTARGGRTSVLISADATAKRALVRVADTGVGIAPEMLPYPFQPFMQADNTLDRTEGGLGLGLALVKGLVELHGGDIRVRSMGLGHGTEFVVHLPLVPARPATPSSALGCQAARPRDAREGPWRNAPAAARQFFGRFLLMRLAHTRRLLRREPRVVARCRMDGSATILPRP